MNTYRPLHALLPMVLCILLSGCSYFFPSSGTLMGTVVDTEGKPVFAVSVAIDPDNSRHIVQSDATGRFVFSSVSSGLHSLYMTASGYQPLDTRVWIPADSTTTLSFLLQPLPQQNTTDSQNIPLEQTCTGILTGTVTDNKGRPLLGATVRIAGTERGARTRPDGRFTIAKLEPGACTLTASYIGFEKATQPITVVADTIIQVDIMMTPAESRIDSCMFLISRLMVDNNQTGTIRTVDMETYHAP